LERVDTDLLSRTALREEHFHRYHLSAQLCKGTVVDCACGIGYGSALLLQQSEIENYLGIDPSQDSVTYATQHYGSDRARFEVGTLESNNCSQRSVDSFVMLETLEHLADPSPALASVAVRLSDDGILIGSVPSAGYEDLCSRVYGPNPHHLQRFTQAELQELLGAHFEAFALFSISFEMGTLLLPLDTEIQHPQKAHVEDRHWVGDRANRSFLFVAGRRATLRSRISALGHGPIFYAATLKTYVDDEESEAIRRALVTAEEQSLQRWEIINAQDTMILDRDKTIHHLTDETAQYRSSNDFLLACLEFLKQKHQDSGWMIAGGQSASLLALDRAISDKGAPFSDIAFSFYQFIERLFATACQAGLRDIYFLSREGWDLKEMFDTYQKAIGFPVPIRSHYLEVSRRSSFLLSLGPLEHEKFEILFRQYRDISLESFLRSLGLEGYGSAICAVLDVEPAEYVQQKADFPTGPLFQRLIESDLFRQIYEAERTNRSAALARYVASFTDGVLPDKLVLVDVGWKGSIQDNLFRWFRGQKGDQAEIQGYYFGLIAQTSSDPRNGKKGLLFEGFHARSPGFNIFNENRSLFEILLPARHGGPHSYEIGADGQVSVQYEPFHEQEMIEAHVEPIVREIRRKFDAIIAHQLSAGLSDEALFRLTCKRHARMVFRPKPAEIAWFSRIYHRENFGVFGESQLSPAAETSGFFDRIRFTLRLLMRRRPSEIGFWPYLTLRRHAFFGASTAYRAIRKCQESSLKC
jgi:2-polyprenyl-3-methyl-5-hydroxy-6-metoxy-1,4-benzoquinol methylase